MCLIGTTIECKYFPSLFLLFAVLSYCKVHVNIHIEIETGELFASLCTCVLSLSCYSRTFSIVPHPTPPPLQGLQGDMVVGVNTGTPKVQVHVRERA